MNWVKALHWCCVGCHITLQAGVASHTVTWCGVVMNFPNRGVTCEMSFVKRQ